MLANFNEYGYLGIFLGLLASGMGFPIPEELPVLMAGVMVGHPENHLRWYYMLPVVMLGVVAGDGFLYGIGRLWGTRLLDIPWVQRNLVPAETRAKIETNFHDRGIAVLLGARLLPGIRTPIFIMAGVLRVPLARFLLADGLYAIPGVNVLFWLAYMLTDQVVDTFRKIEPYRNIAAVVILSAAVGVVVYRYVLTKHVSTGEPPPPIIAKPAEALTHAVETVVEKVAHAAHLGHDRPPPDRPPDPARPAPSPNGAPAADEPKSSANFPPG